MKNADQISELSSTLDRQKMAEKLNYLGGIFNESKTDGEQLYTTNMPELESQESAAQRLNQQGKGSKF